MKSTVIYPPVDMDAFTLCNQKEDYFLTVSRLVHYKQVQTIVDAFRFLPEEHLIVIGDGPLHKELSPTQTL